VGEEFCVLSENLPVAGAVA